MSRNDQYNLEIEKRIRQIAEEEKRIRQLSNEERSKNICPERDSMLDLAAKCVVDSANASTSIIQRRLKIGYARAGRLLDELEQLGVVGPHQGAKPRDVLVTHKEWEKIYNELPAEKETVIDDDSHDNDYSVLSDAEIRKMIAETPSVSEIYKTKFGIDIDYSNDGFFIDKLENSIFPNTNDNDKELFITNIVTYASPDKIKLMLINDGIAFDGFRGAPHLLIPIISDNNKAMAAFSWLLSEMKNRLSLFADSGKKDINTYNASAEPNLKMPQIVVIVNEVYHLFNNSGVDDFLIPLLLNSKRTGISIYLFSRFSLKNLSLGIKADLLKIGDTTDLKQIFTKTSVSSSHYTIEEIDNHMNGYGFEKFCGELLLKNGFSNITVTQSSGDYGADIVAVKDGIKYSIQCKKYSSPVGISAIQEVIASKSIYNCHVACVLTNSSFTPAAVELARKNLVILWDRNKLKDFIDKANI